MLQQGLVSHPINPMKPVSIISSFSRREVWNASYEQAKEADAIAQRLKELLATSTKMQPAGLHEHNKKAEASREGEVQELRAKYQELTGELFDNADENDTRR